MKHLSRALPLFLLAGCSASSSQPQGRVLRVGAFHGMPGNFPTIQSAVDQALPGDWILVGPGDYRESASPAVGVYVTTPGIHLRGMDRGGVIVDGTLPGGKAANEPCSSDPAAQKIVPNGRSGIQVQKVDGVTIENLTVCNFLSDSNGNGGNEVWFNGGDGSGAIGMGSWYGGWITATSTFFQTSSGNVGQYGLFASNASGPGAFEYCYGSNMADAGFYIGACPDCNAAIRYGHSQYNALGYSGSNSGGHLILENSEWDNNGVGILPSSLASDDLPGPQDGACPDALSGSCTLIRGNWVHDNNNRNTPSFGITAGSPVGTGIEIAGGRNDTVEGNTITNQGAWGILVNDLPDTTPAISSPLYCSGGTPGVGTPFGPACYYHAYGNLVTGNILGENGFFGNPTNGDLADASEQFDVDNCFNGNVDLATGQPSGDPANIQDVLGTCGVPGQGDLGQLFFQLACDAYGICPGGGNYPQTTQVKLAPIPSSLPGMPDPCVDVPANPWCG